MHFIYVYIYLFVSYLFIGIILSRYNQIIEKANQNQFPHLRLRNPTDAIQHLYKSSR